MKTINVEKIKKIWLNVFPFIFWLGAFVLSFTEYVVVQLDYNGTYKYKKKFGFTDLFSGNPQIIALLGVILMLVCLLVIPKTMLKKRKSGDGLGLMFMPLGLLGIFHILCTIENDKDLEIGIIFGVILFIVSALATFKKYIKYVNFLCIIMILAGFFTLLAGFMPYCFNKIPFLVGEQVAFTKYFYVSYFSRDVFLLLSFGTFCDKISTKYSEIK
ncbi:MAG: hypothetical protein PUB67_01695 [Clostridiales bacterium]|nr:hypothetical protein [Clostridiales bacterium]